jgi:hypothetical protein
MKFLTRWWLLAGAVLPIAVSALLVSGAFAGGRDDDDDDELGGGEEGNRL